jgi:hypothetical protein
MKAELRLLDENGEEKRNFAPVPLYPGGRYEIKRDNSPERVVRVFGPGAETGEFLGKFGGSVSSRHMALDVGEEAVKLTDHSTYGSSLDGEAFDEREITKPGSHKLLLGKKFYVGLVASE